MAAARPVAGPHATELVLPKADANTIDGAGRAAAISHCRSSPTSPRPTWSSPGFPSLCQQPSAITILIENKTKSDEVELDLKLR